MKDTALTIGVTLFLSNPLRIFLPWRALRPLREIQLLFLGSKAGFRIAPTLRQKVLQAAGE
jgi:hypothetical protein